ncbi:MAG: DUF4168 domain-containing protein [Gemmatimonadota bacterium]
MHTRITRILVLSAVVTLLTFAGAPEAIAQEAAPPPTSGSVELTNTELEDFAEAYVEVQEIGMAHQEALAAAASAEEAQALQAQASEEMAAAVQSHGVTPEEYTEVVNALNQDEELLLRFSIILEELGYSEDGR